MQNMTQEQQQVVAKAKAELEEKKRNPFGPFDKPWKKPPYAPFKFYDDVDAAQPILNEDMTKIDLTPYLSKLSNDPNKQYKYPVNVSIKEPEKEQK